jgi:hypothetical protein
MVVNVSIVDRVKNLLKFMYENMVVSVAQELWFGLVLWGGGGEKKKQ